MYEVTEDDIRRFYIGWSGTNIAGNHDAVRNGLQEVIDCLPQFSSTEISTVAPHILDTWYRALELTVRLSRQTHEEHVTAATEMLETLLSPPQVPPAT